MASKLLAASIATPAADDSQKCYFRSGNTISRTSSSSSSLLLQPNFPGYGGKGARSFRGLSAGCAHAISLHNIDLKYLHEGRRKRTDCGFMTDYKLRKGLLECGIHDGLAPCHRCDAFIRDPYREACEFDGNKHIGGSYRNRRIIVCGSFLRNPFEEVGVFMRKQDETTMERRKLFSFCARAMVASHMVQSPLLSFLWANWPIVVKELSSRRQAGRNRFLTYLEQYANTKPAHESFCRRSFWKVLLLGFLLGTAITVTLTSAVSLPALLDLCFWLCLLCSLVHLVAHTMQGVYVAMMFITRGGLTPFRTKFSRSLQKNVSICSSKSICRQKHSIGIWPLVDSIFKAQSTDFSNNLM